MTTEQEAALIELVTEMAGEYIQQMSVRATRLTDTEQRRDARREINHLAETLCALRRGDKT